MFFGCFGGLTDCWGQPRALCQVVPLSRGVLITDSATVATRCQLVGRKSSQASCLRLQGPRSCDEVAESVIKAYLRHPCLLVRQVDQFGELALRSSIDDRPFGIDDGNVAVFDRATPLGLSGINRTGTQGYATVVLLPPLHPGLT